MHSGTFSCSWGSSLGVGGERTPTSHYSFLSKDPTNSLWRGQNSREGNRRLKSSPKCDRAGEAQLRLRGLLGEGRGLRSKAHYLQMNSQLLLPAGWVMEEERSGAHRGILWALTGPSNHKLNSVL